MALTDKLTNIADAIRLQNSKIYRCTRDTGNPVYNALSELVGLYVEEV